MKPFLHAKLSVKKFGGAVSDYIDIHNWFDQTKAHIPDSRHRLVLHNSFGIYLCEQQFGDIVDSKKMPYIRISTGKEVSVRDIAENHVLEDLGFIPTLADCFDKTGFGSGLPSPEKGRATITVLKSQVKILD